jgi:hypothetical protein
MDINHKNISDNNCLIIASFAKNVDGNNCLIISSANNDKNFIEYLIEKIKIDPKIKNNNGRLFPNSMFK